MDFRPRSAIDRIAELLLPVIVLVAVAGCQNVRHQPATAAATGEEMIVAGERIPTGTRVVTWKEPAGYNGYAGRAALAFRESALSRAKKKRIAQQGWKRRDLREVVDQIVVHYDACGLSKLCFDVLQARGLSVHFLIDVDGTVYQTLDLQERALHATTSNDRSIGIELANIGAYPAEAAAPLGEWYRPQPGADTRLVVPAQIGSPRILTPGFAGRPARPEPVHGVVQGKPLVQYDFTPEQYAALSKLAAALCREFPRLRCNFPREVGGALLAQKLPADALPRYRGILGHYHLQENKVDPGPAFQWAAFIEGVRHALADER